MTPATSGFAAVVPSAGSSSRMGRDKALLEIEGRSFLARIVEALTTAGCRPVLVVVASGDDEIASEAELLGARVIVNPDPGEGPITSLRLAIRELGESVEGIVYLPVDHPLVRGETVAALLEEARSSQAPLTVPMRGEKRGHPALFRSTIFSELLDPSLTGGARTVVHRHLERARLVQVDDPGVIADIDTPEAYERVLAERARSGATS